MTAGRGRLGVLSLTLAALIAFAANSVLCRIALAEGAIEPGPFTTIRLLSGVAALAALSTLSGGLGGVRASASIWSAAALFVYAACFSFAYVSLETGTGALALFGAVQVTMLGGAVLLGERVAPARWAGGGLAMAGLAYLAAPGMSAPEPLGFVLMAIAGAGWGVYSLRGREATAPLAATTGNFALTAPMALILIAITGVGGDVSLRGALLAAASGALASGCGYAVWYMVLPRLDVAMAAIAMLTVPVIALIGGIVLLGEAATWRFAIAGALILGGVALATLAPARGTRFWARRR